MAHFLFVSYFWGGGILLRHWFHGRFFGLSGVQLVHSQSCTGFTIQFGNQIRTLCL